MRTIKIPVWTFLTITILLLLLTPFALHAQSEIDLGTRTKGQLQPAKILPGVAGQCLTTNISGQTAWATCSAGGGSGAVTSFSAGNLAPLFTCSVSNPTTTPALTCTLSNAAAHTYLGNNTGAPAGPGFVHPASTELADFSTTAPASAGKIPIYDPSATNAAGGTGAYVPGDPLVQGLNADGSTSAENPVAIGGYDTAGTPALHRATFINGNPAGTEYGIVTRNVPSGTQTVSGSVSVSNFPATQPVSGSVAATQSGTWTVQPGNTANTTAWKVDPSGVTSPVSLASVPLPNGAAQDSTLTGGTTKAINRGGAKGTTTAADVTSTASGTNHQGLDIALYDASGNQLGLSGTPVRIDPTGTTTQPVSGTVTTSPPANASTNVSQINGVTPLMGNGVTGTGSQRVTIASDNTAFSVNAGQSGTWTVQPGNTANTTAWKVDGSAVIQPVSVASTLNVQGAKTNNNAAPGATNVGTLPALANAAPPSFTEGNQTAMSLDLGGNLRVFAHPMPVSGCYTVNGRTGTYSALSSGAILVSFRWTSSTLLAVIQRVKVNVITSTAATTAGEAERELHIVRSFTASDTGGTAITMTGNNAKMRTSQATSAVGDFRAGQPLTAGTGTADANPVSSAVAWLPLNFTGVDIGCGGAGPTGAVWSCAGGTGPVDLLNATNGQEYPLILAQNEGWRITIGKDAMPSTAVQQTTFTVEWCEVSAY